MSDIKHPARSLDDQPPVGVTEFILRATRPPHGARSLRVWVSTHNGTAEVSKLLGAEGAWGEADVQGQVQVLLDAFWRHMIVTEGVQLTLPVPD